MKTIKLDLSPEIAAKVLPLLEEQYAQLGLQIQRIKGWQTREKEIEKELEDGKEPKRIDPATERILPLDTPPKTETGRSKRGETRRLILEYLGRMDGKAVGVKEISDATGTKYGSCTRILRDLKDEGFATSRKRLWARGPRGVVHDANAELNGTSRH